MAANTSFKVQCPTCEALVPIRDPGLVGKKIDCPKCKYRFVVKEPDEDEDDKKPKKKDERITSDKGGKPAKAAPRSRKDEDDEDDESPRPKKKKAAAGNSTLILGGGLAVVAIGAIVAGAIMFWPSGDSKPSGGGGGAFVGGPGAKNNEPNKEGETKKEADPVVAAPKGTLVNISNLLPNDTQAVISYPMGSTLASSLKPAALEEGGFQSAHFEQRMGFALDGVNRIITALNYRDNWVFTLLQTTAPYKQDVLKTRLALAPTKAVTGKSGKAHQVFTLKGELDALGTLLLQANQTKSEFVVHFLDSNTIVFADPSVMNKFLAADGKPELLSKDGPPPAPPAAGGMMVGGVPGPGMFGGPPMAGGGPGIGGPVNPGVGGGPPMAGGVPGGDGGRGGPDGGRGGGKTGGGPEMGMMGGNPGTGTAGGEGQTQGSYLSVEPTLKFVLDRVEKLEENKTSRKMENVSLVTVASTIAPLKPTITKWINETITDQALAASGATLPLPGFLIRTQIVAEIDSVRSVAASLNAFSQTQLVSSVAADFKDRRKAAELERGMKLGLPTALPLLAREPKDGGIGLRLSFAGASAGGMGGVGGEGGIGGVGIPGGMFGGPEGGGGGRMGTPPPGVVGGGGRGGMVPPGVPGGGGRIGGPPGLMIGGVPGGPIGGVPGGPIGGVPGMGEQGGMNRDNDGALTLALDDTTVSLALDTKINDTAFNGLFSTAQEQMRALKSAADLASPHSRIHELAEALKKYVTEKSEFPRGALPRPLGGGDRTLPYRPDERLSWAVDLLPHLGNEYVDWKLDLEGSWLAEKNAPFAKRVVAPLLAHHIPGLAPARITYPGQGEQPFGASHFVAMAGLGYDAAELVPSSPDYARKAGIFGYDRVVKRVQVADGLDKTIALILVPDEHKSPWMMSGGATVRGVSDDPTDAKPMAPFVCATFPGQVDKFPKFKGKRGTIAIMADGKVRFLPEDLDPKMFRAMCTYAGGEEISGLETLCPVIEMTERTLRTDAPLPLPVPAVKDKPKEKEPKPAPTPTASNKPDKELILGSWKMSEYQSDGTRGPSDQIALGTCTVDADTITISSPGGVKKFTYKLDPAKKTIDLTPTDATSKSKLCLGIYSLNDNELRLCYTLREGVARPTTIAATGGSKCELAAFKRAGTSN